MHSVCWHSRLLQLPVWIGPVPPEPVEPPPDEIEVPPVPDGDPPWPPELAGFGLTPAQPAPIASESTRVATRRRVITPYVSGPESSGSCRPQTGAAGHTRHVGTGGSIVGRLRPAGRPREPPRFNLDFPTTYLRNVGSTCSVCFFRSRKIVI